MDFLGFTITLSLMIYFRRVLGKESRNIFDFDSFML